MLKIPHVRIPLTDYLYIASIIGNSVEVEIIYTKNNIYGKRVHKLLNLVLYTDVRWPNLKAIKNSIDKILGGSKNSVKSTIRIDSERMYIHFNSNQYTGKQVL